MGEMIKKSENKILTTSGEIELSPDTVKKYLVRGNGTITDQETIMFIGMCKANKLNPFNNDAYLIKFGTQPATMIVSKDVFFKRAIDNPNYNGMKSGIIVVKGDNIIKRDGHIYIKGQEEIIGAWCEVFRKDWTNSVYQEVNFCEYAGYTKEGKLNSNWASRPAVMITKVAESTALRKAFTDNLQNMYIAEEIEQPIQEEQKEEIEDFLEDDENDRIVDPEQTK